MKASAQSPASPASSRPARVLRRSILPLAAILIFMQPPVAPPVTAQDFGSGGTTGGTGCGGGEVPDLCTTTAGGPGVCSNILAGGVPSGNYLCTPVASSSVPELPATLVPLFLVLAGGLIFITRRSYAKNAA